MNPVSSQVNSHGNISIVLSTGSPTIPIQLSRALGMLLLTATSVPSSQFGCQLLRSLCTWLGGLVRGHCGRTWGRGAGGRRADSGRPRDFWAIFVRVGKIHRCLDAVQTDGVLLPDAEHQVLKALSWKYSKLLQSSPLSPLNNNNQAF